MPWNRHQKRLQSKAKNNHEKRQIATSPVYIDETELMRKKGSELELVSIRSAKCCEILLNHEADPDLRDNHVSFWKFCFENFRNFSLKVSFLGFDGVTLCLRIQ